MTAILDYERKRSIVLDASALLRAMARGDSESVNQLLDTYLSDPAELAELACAVTAHGVCLARLAAFYTGSTPETILTTAADTIRAAQ